MKRRILRWLPWAGLFKYTKQMGKDNRKKKAITITLISMMLVTGGLAFWFLGVGEPEGYTTLTPRQAMELIKSREDLMIVDIRGPQELVEGWIDGSVLMPMTEILQGRMAPPKDRPILLVCAVGGRSLGLGKAMASYGWKEIYNLQSGIAEWKRQGLPLRYR